MTATIISTTEQKIEINDIKDVVVTTVEQDTDGDWVREIRFFGTPAEGLSADSVQTLVVRIKSATKANLEITTPALAM